MEESIYYILYVLHYYPKVRNAALFKCDDGQSAPDYVQLLLSALWVSNEPLETQLFHASIAAESLSAVQGEIDELSIAAESEYRWVIPFLKPLSMIPVCPCFS